MPESTCRKILFLVNEASFFCSHRLPLAIEALARGLDVVVVCGAGTGEAALEEAGIRARTVPLSRSGIHPFAEWRAYRALVRVYREEAPDIAHHVTIKPLIYGTRAARVIGVLGILSCGFLLFTLLTSNPFERLVPAPPDGADLNPLLQDVGLTIHPPLLYIGYVGFAVAFAFAIAAMLTGDLDRTWARWTRPWTTFTARSSSSWVASAAARSRASRPRS